MTNANRGVLPGFGLSLGITSATLGLLVVIPLAGLAVTATTAGFDGMWHALASPRAVSAFRVSFGTAAAAALLDAPLGLLLAWALTRYRFPGRRILDALVDLPFALPTSVAGIALTTLFVDDGWLGAWLAPLGIHVAFSALGIGAALAFVGLPFVIRSIQPVLAEFERDAEEAALTLGARPMQVFGRVILPALVPALLTGMALALARGVGEYGSVIFIAGNRPGRSEIVPLMIVGRLEQFDYAGAAVLGLAMLVLSFGLLAAMGAVQARLQRRTASTLAT